MDSYGKSPFLIGKPTINGHYTPRKLVLLLIVCLMLFVVVRVILVKNLGYSTYITIAWGL